MSKRIAIFGAGAAGSYLGAFLTREGYDITSVPLSDAKVQRYISSAYLTRGK